jgi:hypothetical protein
MMMIQTMIPNRRSGAITAMMLLLATTGCGDKVATITGQVTMQSVPIPNATIAFIGQHGKVVSGTVEDGSYVVTGVEIGPDATVTITSHVPSPMVHPPTGPETGAPVYPPGQYVPVPDRYGDSKRSKLTCQVVAGAQMLNFDLQP